LCTETPINNKFLKKWKNYKYQSSLGTYYYIFNVKRKPFDNVNVRMALALVINRKKLSTELQFPVTPAFGIVPAVLTYKPIRPSAINIDKARKLLAVAGYPGGKGMRPITILYNSNEGHRKIARYIQGQWTKLLGIKVVLKDLHWFHYLKTLNKKDFDIVRMGWIGDYTDPHSFLELFTLKSGYNQGGYDNKIYNQLIKKAVGMSNIKKRYSIYKQAEKILILKDQAILPIYYYGHVNLINLKKWGGWYNNILNLHPLKSIYKR